MIICCGEALIDMIRTQVPGTGEVFLPMSGGSPYNSAIAIGRLKVPVKFLGRFSTDFFGEILIKKLRDNRVGDELIIRSPQNTTLAFVKADKKKEPMYVFYTEGSADRSLEAQDLPDELPADTKCILFGSIAMTMEPIASAIETLIQREGSRKSTDQMDGGPVISFDPNIRPFMIKDRDAYITRFEKWVAASTIAKISSVDFKFLYPEMNPEQALQKILSMGPRLAICTLGSKGALALLRRNDGSVIKVNAPAINLPVVDTIGAGDTFHGAFLSRLEIKGKMSRSALAALSEEDLYDAMFFANKAASIVCSRCGAEPPTLKEVQSLKPQDDKSKAAPKRPAPAKDQTEKEPAKTDTKASVKSQGKTPAASAKKPKTAEDEKISAVKTTDGKSARKKSTTPP